MSASSLFPERFERTRALTLELVALASDDEVRRALHPDLSPVLWHLGHIAAFEAAWLLGEPLDLRFDPRALKKTVRPARLPARADVLAFAADVRRRVRPRLDDGDPVLLQMVWSHEQQHAETIAWSLRLRSAERRARVPWPLPDVDAPASPASELAFHAGEVELGEPDTTVGQDNERAVHRVPLAPFAIDARPVTNAEWLGFIDAGGYERAEWWTAEGWAWREKAGVTHPATWARVPGGWLLRAFAGDVPLPMGHPVEGVSAHEADAYACWAGKRLPTEAEWERAARQVGAASPRIGLRAGATRAAGADDWTGNVWEWTASAFAAYPGFEPGPYGGYSAPYFDGRHRVLRGGSWATQEANARASFRNWFEPHWRVVFAGLRCARSL